MYIPKSFAETETATLYQFMRDHNFATLVTGQDSQPDSQLTATHLPFMVDAERGLLRAHLARANAHWKSFDGREALVIFQGPHAYISPSWYENQPSVPTWNYTAVHVYGVPQVVDDLTTIRDMLRDLVENHEHGRQPEWSMDLPEDYLHKMLLGIVAFEMPIARIEGKFKLSQNRPETDQDSVIVHLSESTAEPELETARLMTERRAKEERD